MRGKISETDHLSIRTDGSFQLHLHARLTTEDGVNIAFPSEGVSFQIEGEGETQLGAAVSLFMSSKAYKWLNKLQLWAWGSLDPEEGKVFVKAYAV